MGKSSKNEKKSKKKHKERREKNKKSKKLKKQREKKNKVAAATEKNVQPTLSDDHNKDNNDDFAIPLELMNSKSHAPETPEEYQQRQERIRRELDPITGRSRLIKGDGEVLEEIVSRDRHMTINKEATKGDGHFFQENTLGKLK